MLGPGGTDSPHFLKEQDCLWNSEEQHRGADQLYSLPSVWLLAVPEAVLCLKKMRSITSAGFSLRRELCLEDVPGYCQIFQFCILETNKFVIKNSLQSLIDVLHLPLKD